MATIFYKIGRAYQSLSASFLKAHLYLKLSLYNRIAKDAVVDDLSNVVVSVTSHGIRIKRVYACIESIGQGTVKPNRLFLFISKSHKGSVLPKSLQRLQARGLEVIFCEDVGPHTKYWPFLKYKRRGSPLPLVTADDDKMYPSFWLDELYRAWVAFPEYINCFRAREIIFDGKGLSPYSEWPLCSSDSPAYSHFATGVSGVIYPPRYLDALLMAGEDFRSVCPFADDIWLHCNALRSGFRVRQIRSRSIDFPGIPLSSRTALHVVNIGLGRNDQQISSTYNERDFATLRSELNVG